VNARDSFPVVREAVTLPLVLLTVALGGGARVVADGSLRFVVPPLMALVLAAMLLGLMTRAGLVAPERLFSPARRPLQNANGGLVLLSLFAASAQMFHMLTPDRGLLHLLFNVLFLVLLLNTFAGRTDRRHLLRHLLVLFGSALVLKFVVLQGLGRSNGSLAKRLFSTALEGVSLGSLHVESTPASAGYLAFAILGLFFLGLWLLPPGATPTRTSDRGRDAA
jgi:hypothetical protein